MDDERITEFSCMEDLAMVNPTFSVYTSAQRLMQLEFYGDGFTQDCHHDRI